jgi:hypothetical protein
MSNVAAPCSVTNCVGDVAATGGWKGTQMLLKCYQQPDPDTILAVMNEPQKLGQQWEAATSCELRHRARNSMIQIWLEDWGGWI